MQICEKRHKSCACHTFLMIILFEIQHHFREADIWEWYIYKPPPLKAEARVEINESFNFLEEIIVFFRDFNYDVRYINWYSFLLQSNAVFVKLRHGSNRFQSFSCWQSKHMEIFRNHWRLLTKYTYSSKNNTVTFPRAVIN